MSTFQLVTGKAADVAKLNTGFLTQAAASLLNEAEGLSLDEMAQRLEGALRALRGEEVPASGAAPTARRPRLEMAQEIVDSYSYNKKTGVSTFIMPAGVTDVEAMRALNEYYRKHLPHFKGDVIESFFAQGLVWFEGASQNYPRFCKHRDYSQARQIIITAVVKSTEGKDWQTQKHILEKASLIFSDPRDQALAAAIHACKHDGEDLFNDCIARSSVPDFAVRRKSFTSSIEAIKIRTDYSFGEFAASGSPSPDWASGTDRMGVVSNFMRAFGLRRR